MVKVEFQPKRNEALSEEQKRFISNFSSVVHCLERERLDYRVVGGPALRAILGKPVQARRPNGSIPDVDALILSRVAPEKVGQLERSFEWARRKIDHFPQVGLEQAEFGGGRRTPLQFLSGLRVEDNSFFLTYLDVEEEISWETLKPVVLSYGGVEFKSFPAKTVWFRYLVRGCLIKPKDCEKLDELATWIARNPEGQPPDELYAPYFAFAVRVNQKYPARTSLFEKYWQLDQALGGRISRSEGFVYGLKNLFVR